MLRLDTVRMTKSLSGLEAFEPTFEKSGVKYLYDNLFKPIAAQETLLLSDIDFGAFTLDDAAYFERYYDETISEHLNLLYIFSKSLQKAPSAVFRTSFI